MKEPVSALPVSILPSMYMIGLYIGLFTSLHTPDHR